MRILISGAKGQLGRAFVEFLGPRKGVEILALSHEEFDITDFEKVMETVRAFRPSVIINGAAYTLVDQAENEPEKAFEVNTLGVHNLAIAAEREKCFLIHFGTDYVFDGEKGDFYEERDRPRPINFYGLSKLWGENAIRKTTERALIFRVSWLFGKGKRNFLYRVLRWAEDRETLSVAYDEFSSPTYVDTVVRVCWKAFEAGLKGLYHLSSRGACSRYEWTRFWLRTLNLKKKVLPVKSESFGLPARRPFFSALDPSKLEKDLNIELPFWEEEVEKFARTLKTQKGK